MMEALWLSTTASCLAATPGVAGMEIHEGEAYARRETNIGHTGVGIYWSPAEGSHWISYYEVNRDGEVIGKAGTGTFYFDHAPGWSAGAAYAVRAVNGDGVAGDWTTVAPLAGGSDVYAALGGHFAQVGRDGWSAEYTLDGAAFSGMTWVAPAKSPAGDLGGTPNQPGGVEGYWEGPGQARVGRGWQQGSPEAGCVHAWTAPAAGTATIVGRVMKECYRQAMSEPLRVRILHNNMQAWPAEGWAEARPNDLLGAMHHFTLDVKAGDVIRFAMDRGTSPETDILAWMPRIEYATPQSSVNGESIRILCGANEPHTDGVGNAWSPDTFFNGVEPYLTDASVSNATPTANDAVLYQHGWAGVDFTYEIPISTGLHALRLKFAETEYPWAFERPLNLSINGRRVLEKFDIRQAARGANTAYERVFHNLAPNAQGCIALHFTSGFIPRREKDKALVRAIEILPETKPVIRVNAGAQEEFIDWNSYIWSADAYFNGGAVILSESPVTHVSPTLYDQALYQTARAGRDFTYSIPAPPGLYTVHLEFAELWLTEQGQRPMRVEVNGQIVRDNWDPVQAAGKTGMAADIRVADIAPGGTPV